VVRVVPADERFAGGVGAARLAVVVVAAVGRATAGETVGVVAAVGGMTAGKASALMGATRAADSGARFDPAELVPPARDGLEPGAWAKIPPPEKAEPADALIVPARDGRAREVPRLIGAAESELAAISM
jgi:hypothetical protein